MIATGNGMYKSSFPHYTINVRRSLPRSAVDAKAQGLHLTASPVPHAGDQDTNHRYATHWKGVAGSRNGMKTGSTAILLCQLHCHHGSTIFGVPRFIVLSNATHPYFIGTCRHLLRKESSTSTKTDHWRHLSVANPFTASWILLDEILLDDSSGPCLLLSQSPHKPKNKPTYSQ